MSDADPRMNNPFAAQEVLPPPSAAWSPPVGPRADQAMADIMMFNKVSKPRDLNEVKRRGTDMASKAGADFVYRIPFREKLPNGKHRVVNVEGPTIICAASAVTAYTNARAGVISVDDHADHWMIWSVFVDKETNVDMARGYRQRKSQKTGMRDRERALDMIFEIGASKSIRNVVNLSIRWLTNHMMDEAKRSMLDRIAAKPDEARGWLLKKFAEMDLPIERVIAVLGKTPQQWVVPDMARLYAELRAIHEGQATADDLFPADDEGVDERREADKHDVKTEPAGAGADESGDSKSGGTASGGAAAGSTETQPAGQAQGTPATESKPAAAATAAKKATPKPKAASKTTTMNFG